MTNLECRITNRGPEWRFQFGFKPSGHGGGEIHGVSSTLLFIGFSPAAPRFFLATVFRELMRAVRFSRVQSACGRGCDHLRAGLL